MLCTLREYKWVISGKYFFLIQFYIILVKHTQSPDTAIDPCGSQKPLIIEDSISGNITSPNYPENYPSFSDCQWEIRANPGQAVVLIYHEFQTEQG